MKDRTLLAGLWGDYIVNDSDTDGHKLLITSEMTLPSAGIHGACVRVCLMRVRRNKPVSWPCERY